MRTNLVIVENQLGEAGVHLQGCRELGRSFDTTTTTTTTRQGEQQQLTTGTRRSQNCEATIRSHGFVNQSLSLSPNLVIVENQLGEAGVPLQGCRKLGSFFGATTTTKTRQREQQQLTTITTTRSQNCGATVRFHGFVNQS